MEDLDKWKAEHTENLQEKFSNPDFVRNHILGTLENFLYRYLDSSTGSGGVQEIQTGFLVAEYLEPSMKECLKFKNEKAHEGILSLAKSVPKKEKPAVLMRLSCQILSWSDGHYVLNISSLVDWGFPKYESNETTSLCLSNKLELKEVLDLRTELPLALEKACELFNS